MADKITLNSIGATDSFTTTASNINTNNAAIVTAMDNTLSRDGTLPNQMESNLDMSSNRILNLPSPSNNLEPLRLIDAQLLNGGGTITTNPLPVAGTIGQVLTKNSATNYDASWKTSSIVLSAGQVLGNNIASSTVTNSNLSVAPSVTLKGNPTATPNTVSDFTLASLTTSSTPDPINDFLLIEDNLAGTFKKVNANALIGSQTAGVSSIDLQTGLFTTGNGIDSSGKVLELTAARRTLPTRQIFTTAAVGTYSTPANCIRIFVRMVGAGGGGGGNGGSLTSAGSGGNSTFNSVVAAGGGGGSATGNTAGGAGGAGGNGGSGTASFRSSGQYGGTGFTVSAAYSPILGFQGGNSLLGYGGTTSSQAGLGPGGGGCGSQAPSTLIGNAGGGGGGEYVELIINNPAPNYPSITVGAGGIAGTGTGGSGGVGHAGAIIIDEYYGS